jgi:signal transduction histidine kinase
MTGLPARLAPAAWLRAPRPTARLRLTLLYGALFLLFKEATAVAITLPGGAQVIFGNLSPSSSSVHGSAPIGHSRLAPAAEVRVKLSPAQQAHLVANLQAQITQLHAFEMHELLVRSGIALGLTTILSIALGWLVAGRVLRPVRTISATARHISARNLHERLRLDGPDDEFRELAATLDDLFKRLEASFESQRRFVASASHELRTPLTLDRALLERALRQCAPVSTGRGSREVASWTSSRCEPMPGATASGSSTSPAPCSRRTGCRCRLTRSPGALASGPARSTGTSPPRRRSSRR